MRRFARSIFPLVVLFLNSAHAAAPDGKALSPGQTLSASFDKGTEYERRRHPFPGKRGQRVSFSAQWTDHQEDFEGNPTNTLTIGMFWVEDASGTKLEAQRSNGAKLKAHLSVFLPSDGPWFLVSQVRAPASYELEMFQPQAPTVLRLDEPLGAGALSTETYFEVPVTRDQEGKRLALLINGEFPEKLAVALMTAPLGEVLPCEGGPCNTRDFIWQAKAGTHYLRVTPEVTTGCVLGLHSIPADTERITVGRALEGSVGGPSTRKSYLLLSGGGEVTIALTGFEGRLELGPLGKPQAELNAEFLDGRARIPLAKGSWILAVTSNAPLAKKASFRLELAKPRPPPSTVDLLGPTPKEPVGGNVAFIDLNGTMAELPEGKAAKERLKALYDSSKKQLDDKKAEVQAKKGEEQKVAYAALEALARNLEVKLSTENDKATLPALDKLGKAVRKLREERGVMVFEGGVIAWADDSLSLAPAVLKAVTSSAASPKPAPKEHKVGIVDFARVTASSSKAKAAQARLAAIGHYLARAEAAQKEDAVFQEAAGNALEKLAKARGVTLVLLKAGLDAEHPGLVWKTPPFDFTGEVVKAIDAE